MKRSLLLALFLAIGSAHAQPDAPAKMVLSVTQIEVEPTDLSEFLNINSWRFKIQMPDAPPQTLLSRRLELRAPGQKPVVLSNNGTEISDTKSMELLLIMMPEGESLTTAPKLRIMEKIQPLNAGGEKRGGDASKGLRDNPVKGLDVIGYSASDNARPDADGAIVLMNFYLMGNTKEKPNKSQLVLVLTATNPAP